ncbi:hypothetical protein SELMODRAFT_112967 [Selaginella moellendorffii]|uniref:non-specific serine/threonine protein kinase n=1 Tax=Selaginella moellendorffii TaxID=88036 RepID=D8SBB9_SELML|nr:hypothetical protein SELMODRAFT_112967 [Selaginella moellendorffii]
MAVSQDSESNSGTTVSFTPQQQVSSYLGWGNWYCLEELEIATGGFSERNIIGEGGYGIVYKGAVSDGTMVACKYLTNKDQAEKEFLVEVETIGRVRHKNLVKLLGFCAEGDHRILVYEYVNNGNLDEWLHGKTSRFKTPSWDSRMKIILGTAKGLAYMHEAIEPKIVHRDIKASNILLDSHWNAKVSDFGLAKFLGCEKTHVMTRVMGTFGYVAPEYANTGLLNERSDVYSFGVLLMEVVTGRDPVDYSRPPGEVNLVDWLKLMLATRRMDDIADPRLEEKPSPRALKKALITAFQCVHPDVRKRPTMGHVVHLLEAENFQLPDVQKHSFWFFFPAKVSKKICLISLAELESSEGDGIVQAHREPDAKEARPEPLERAPSAKPQQREPPDETNASSPAIRRIIQYAGGIYSYVHIALVRWRPRGRSTSRQWKSPVNFHMRGDSE